MSQRFRQPLAHAACWLFPDRRQRSAALFLGGYGATTALFAATLSLLCGAGAP